MADVRASTAQVEGYSAHADQAGFVDWLFTRTQGKDSSGGQDRVHPARHGGRAQGTPVRDGARAAGELLPVGTILPRSEAIYDLDRSGGKIASENEINDLQEKIRALQEKQRRLKGG